MPKARCTAVVLAAGKGSRMGTEEPKQFLHIGGVPVVVCALTAFQESPLIDEIILVTAREQIDRCREMAGRYGLDKVVQVIAGGRERYESVWNALKLIKSREGAEYVFIHDGARPFVDLDIIERAFLGAEKWGAAVVGMPVKDTIKIVGKDHIVLETPDRSSVWQVQTPQAFRYSLIREAYDRLFEQENISVTDDAMVLESMGNHPIHMVFGSYGNLKITTPEDLLIAEGMWKIQSGNEQRKK